MMMSSRFWRGIGAALCLNGMVVLADETTADKPEAQTANVRLNVNVVQNDPQIAAQAEAQVLEVVIEDTAAKANERQIQVNGDAGKQFGLTVSGAVGEGVVSFQSDQGGSFQPDQGKYWIGLLCNPASEALRTQLDLDGDVGLVVDEITAEGPAAKAGLLRHDILISATTSKEGQPSVHKLSQLVDLVGCIQEAQMSPIKMELIRRGKKQNLEVTPAERPKAGVLNVVSVAPQHVVWDAARLTPNTIGLRWAGPMIVQYSPAGLPEGMTIETTRTDAGAKKIIVKQGQEKWEVDPAALDKLPPSVSEHVRRYLMAQTPQHTTVTTHATAAGHVGQFSGVAVHSQVGALPDDVKVTVIRKGAEPAKISVQKGGLSWEGTEKEFSACPADLRPIAESAVTGYGAARLFAKPVPAPFLVHSVPTNVHPMPPQFSVAFPPGVPTPVGFSGSAPVPTRTNDAEIERQLRELTIQVEKLRLTVEKTQSKQ